MWLLRAKTYKNGSGYGEKKVRMTNRVFFIQNPWLKDTYDAKTAHINKRIVIYIMIYIASHKICPEKAKQNFFQTTHGNSLNIVSDGGRR